MHSSTHTQHTTENNTCIISHSQNKPELNPRVFLTAIQWLLATNNEQSVSEFLFTYFASRGAHKNDIRNHGWETLVCVIYGDLK